MCVVRVANCNWQFDMSKEGVSWLSAHVVKYRCTIVKAPVIAMFLKHVYFYNYLNIMCAWTMDLLVADTLGQQVLSVKKRWLIWEA